MSINNMLSSTTNGCTKKDEENSITKIISEIKTDNDFTTLEGLSELAVHIFFEYIYSADHYMSPKEIRETILKIMDKLCRDFNENYAKTNHVEKIRTPKTLSPKQIAQIMIKNNITVRIKSGEVGSDPDRDLIAVYCTKGENKGIYVTAESEIMKIIQEYSPLISKAGAESVIMILRSIAPRIDRTTDKDLIAVNNGIFDYKTKELKDFDPQFVFLAKSGVNYNPFARNITIHNDEDGTDWDVESWMMELSDDPGIVTLLWQILSAIVRPFVNWNKAAWFYSESGNNGKGTLCELMRQLCGRNAYASVPLDDFGKDFALAKIINTMAIIVDENDVGVFIDKVANLKAVITGDVISINRKHRDIVDYAFKGLVVQCLNEMPRVKDKSESFLRRQILIPFNKCFTGRERKYIKADYLHRKEVLEYVLFRVLNMNFYEFSVPEACKMALEEYKEYNNPVRQFMNEMCDKFVWDLLPFTFLYDLYKAWYWKNNPGGCHEGKQKFISELLSILNDYPEWECENKRKTIRSANRMNGPELLIAEYGLKDWCNHRYTGNDLYILCCPNLKENYTGLTRVGCSSDDADNTP